jgi:hypothetical protein
VFNNILEIHLNDDFEISSPSKFHSLRPRTLSEVTTQDGGGGSHSLLHFANAEGLDCTEDKAGAQHEADAQSDMSEPWCQKTIHPNESCCDKSFSPASATCTHLASPVCHTCPIILAPPPIVTRLSWRTTLPSSPVRKLSPASYSITSPLRAPYMQSARWHMPGQEPYMQAPRLFHPIRVT